MKNGEDKGLFVPSSAYNVVRCRQLEGTYPGDSQTGCWPITSLRVMRGRGSVPEGAWRSSALECWPPPEPSGLDQLAKENRIFRYQRIRNAQECLNAVRRRCPVMASFEITRQWFDAVNGVIQIPEEAAPIVGSHMVTIVGADESFTVMPGSERILFVFDNWWGSDWGIKGRGLLPWEVFDRWLIEAWTLDLISPQSTKRSEIYSNPPGIISDTQHVGEINDPDRDERIAWTIVTPRQDCLDVEELFVTPEHRRKGHGTKLLASLRELSDRHHLPLRFLIPFSDAGPGNLAVIRRLLGRIGYRVELSATRWAPYFGTPSQGADVMPYFPQKPALARPQPMTQDEQKQAIERAGGFDANFQKAAESVFKQHEELLRRLA